MAVRHRAILMAMEMTASVCYRIVTARDRRYEGRFFVAVKTTGIYCRPGCPARTPKRQNVAFYPSAAAAECAGFRACARCRPELSPSIPVPGTHATVSRALKLISMPSDAERTPSLDGLATRLGVTPRHLRRLFSRHLGASVVSVVRSHRAHFARRLLEESVLPVSDVAFASGFGSVRQFHDVMKSTFGRTPSLLRGGAGERARCGAVRLRLPYRPPFDWAGLLAFLAPRALPGVERVVGEGYRRSVRVGSVEGWIDVRDRPRRRCLQIDVHVPQVVQLIELAGRLRRLFDLDADPAPIRALLARDPLLVDSVTSRPGLRVPGCFDGFELALRAILGQQVTVKGATTLAGRIVTRYGRPLGDAGDSGLTHLSPDPALLCDADLRVVGIPGRRAEALRGLARLVRDGELVLEPGAPAERSGDVLGRLAGIGPWTRSYIGMRALAEPDALPAGDLGLRRALTRDGAPATAARLSAHGERWRPWRAYAAMHLWMAPPAPSTKRRSET